MTPEQLRDIAYEEERRAVGRLRRSHADLLERYAKLKAHAEAMAEVIMSPLYHPRSVALKKYRADFVEYF
jgi:hypothetical protein